MYAFTYFNISPNTTTCDNGPVRKTSEIRPRIAVLLPLAVMSAFYSGNTNRLSLRTRLFLSLVSTRNRLEISNRERENRSRPIALVNRSLLEHDWTVVFPFEISNAIRQNFAEYISIDATARELGDFVIGHVTVDT